MQRREFLGSPMLLATQASRSQHKCLFNADCNTFFYNPEIWQPEGLPYSVKAIHRYLDTMAASGVDTFLMNPGAQVAWYPSKTMPTALDGYKRGDREFLRPHAAAAQVAAADTEAYLVKMSHFLDLYLDLKDAGVDWLRKTALGCKARGMSPWLSMRMNDMHGARNPASPFNCNLFRDPKMRLSGKSLVPGGAPNVGWAALNYGKPEVRDFIFRHLQDQVTNYPYEGMELDWLRDPHCLEPGAGATELRMMRAWIERVRDLCKGKPLGLRVPANLQWMKDRGVDTVGLVRAGLIDFVSVSNFWQTTWDVPYDELRRELGDRVSLYGVIEDAPNWVEGRAEDGKHGLRYLSASAPMVRANAAGKLAMGVDGIYAYNYFCTDQPAMPGMRADYGALKGIANLEGLRGKSKHYCFCTPTTWLAQAWETPEQLPLVLEPRWRKELRLSMAREIAGVKMTVQLAVEKSATVPAIALTFNGHWPVNEREETDRMLFPVGPYTRLPEGLVGLNYQVSAEWLVEGWNRILLQNAGQVSVLVRSVEIGIAG